VASDNAVLTITDSFEHDSLVYTLPGAATGPPVVTAVVTNTFDYGSGNITYSFAVMGYPSTVAAALLDGQTIVYGTGAGQTVSKTFSDSAMTQTLTPAEVTIILGAETASQQIALSPSNFTAIPYDHSKLVLIDATASTPSTYNVSGAPVEESEVFDLVNVSISDVANQSATTRDFTFNFSHIPVQNDVGNPITWDVATVALTSEAAAGLDSKTLTLPGDGTGTLVVTINLTDLSNTFNPDGSALTWKFTGAAEGGLLWGQIITQTWTATQSGSWTLYPEYLYLDSALALTVQDPPGNYVLGAIRPTLTASPLFTSEATYQWYKKAPSSQTDVVTLTNTPIPDEISSILHPSFTEDTRYDAYACRITITPPAQTTTTVSPIVFISLTEVIQSLAVPAAELTPALVWGPANQGIGLDTSKYYLAIKYVASTIEPLSAGAVLSITTDGTTTSTWSSPAINTPQDGNYINTGTVYLYAQGRTNGTQYATTPSGDSDYFDATDPLPTLTSSIVANGQTGEVVINDITIYDQAAIGFSQTGLATQSMLAFVQASDALKDNGGVLVLWSEQTNPNISAILYMNGFPSPNGGAAPSVTATNPATGTAVPTC
jgi:hypothetical protein